jgi:hypothetical protein
MHEDDATLPLIPKPSSAPLSDSNLHRLFMIGVESDEANDSDKISSPGERIGPYRLVSLLAPEPPPTPGLRLQRADYLLAVYNGRGRDRSLERKWWRHWRVPVPPSRFCPPRGRCFEKR